MEVHTFSYIENGHLKSIPSNRGNTMVRSIFDITERNEESEITGGTKSLLSNIFNRVDSKHHPHETRCNSQTFRFSNLSNNLMSQHNAETTELEAAVVAETVESEKYSIVEQ